MRAETCLEFFRQKVALNDASEYHIVDHTKALREREKNDGPQPRPAFRWNSMTRSFTAGSIMRKTESSSGAATRPSPSISCSEHGEKPCQTQIWTAYSQSF